MFSSYFLSYIVLAIAAILCLVWLSALIFFIVGYRQKSRDKMRVGGIIFFLISIFVGMNYLSSHNPSNVYAASFDGRTPSSDVTNLRSDADYGSDTRIFLAFKASAATIKQIKSDGWKQRNTDDWAKNGGENNKGKPRPNWWTPQKTARTQVFERIDHNAGDFLTEEETLIYDVGTQQAYYSYHSVDYEDD